MPEPRPSAADRRRALADAQRAVMQRFPTGVSVVTAFDTAGAPRGMTVSALCSLSLDPPMLLVCLRSASQTLAAVRTSGRFAVHLLHADAVPLAELFASPVPDRFAGVDWRGGGPRPDAAGPHLAAGAHAIADCRVERCQSAGDHTVVFGAISRITDLGGPPPLVYGLRGYAPWPAADVVH